MGGGGERFLELFQQRGHREDKSDPEDINLGHLPGVHVRCRTRSEKLGFISKLSAAANTPEFLLSVGYIFSSRIQEENVMASISLSEGTEHSRKISGRPRKQMVNAKHGL